MRLGRLIFLDLDLRLSISTLGAVTAFFGQSGGISLYYIHMYMYIFDAISRYMVPDNGFSISSLVQSEGVRSCPFVYNSPNLR